MMCVIILATERRLSGDFIDQLLGNPITAAGFVPFTREELHERN